MSVIIWTGDGSNNLLSNPDNNNQSQVPGSGDIIIFDGATGGSPNKDCTWDVPAVSRLDNALAYTGVIIQSVAVFVTLNFDFVTNATSHWIQNSFNLTVDGDTSVTGAGKGIVNVAGDTIRMNGDITITNSVLSHYAGVVLCRNSVATPDVAKIHDVNWPDDKSMAMVRTWGKNQTINLTGPLTSNADTFEDNTTMTDDGISTKAWTVLGVLVTPENCTFDASSEGAIRLSVQNVAIPTGADFGTFRIFVRNNVDTIEGVWATTGPFEFQNFNTGLTETCNITGKINADMFEIGVGGTPDAGFDVTQESGSDVNFTGNVIVYADDGVELNRWTRLAGTLNTVINGSLTVQDKGELDFSADSSLMFIAGNIALSATAVIDWGDVTVILFGGADQNIDWGGNPPKKILELKSGGILTYADAWVLTGIHEIRVLGNYTVVYLASGSYGSDELIIDRGALIGNDVRVTIESDDTGVTAFDYVAQNAGPVSRHANINDMNLTTAIQQISSQSGSLVGILNNLFPPTDGWQSVDSPRPGPAYGYDRYTQGVGIGLGLGVGGAYD